MRRVSDAMTRDGMAGRKKGGKRSTVSNRLGSVLDGLLQFKLNTSDI